MSNILNKLKELSNYYRLTRGVGHTTRMLMGVTTVKYNAGQSIHGVTDPAIILTHDKKWADELNDIINYYNGFRKNIVARPFSSNYGTILRGQKAPLLIDNCLLYLLFSDAANEIENGLAIQDKLDVKIESLEAEKKSLVNKIDKLEKNCQAMSEKIIKLEFEKLDREDKSKEEFKRIKSLDEKLELAAAKSKFGKFSKEWIYKNVFKMSECEVSELLHGIIDKNQQSNSFISPLDLVMDNKEIKSVEVKIEYKWSTTPRLKP